MFETTALGKFPPYRTRNFSQLDALSFLKRPLKPSFKQRLELVSILCCDRIPPVLAETPLRHTNPGRGLTALVFVLLDESHHSSHVALGIALVQYFLERYIMFHVGFKDAV